MHNHVVSLSTLLLFWELCEDMLRFPIVHLIFYLTLSSVSVSLPLSLSRPQLLSIAYTSSAREGTSCSLPLSMMGFIVAWSFTGFMQAFMTAKCSEVQPACCVQKTLFSCSPPPPLADTHCSSLPQWSLSPHRKVLWCRCSISGWTFCDVLFSHLDKSWVSVLISIFFKRRLLWCGLGDALFCGYSDNTLEVGLTLSVFSSITVEGFPLG